MCTKCVVAVETGMPPMQAPRQSPNRTVVLALLRPLLPSCPPSQRSSATSLAEMLLCLHSLQSPTAEAKMHHHDDRGGTTDRDVRVQRYLPLGSDDGGWLQTEKTSLELAACGGRKHDYPV
jgi:hypothetical protein